MLKVERSRRTRFSHSAVINGKSVVFVSKGLAETELACN